MHTGNQPTLLTIVYTSCVTENTRACISESSAQIEGAYPVVEHSIDYYGIDTGASITRIRLSSLTIHHKIYLIDIGYPTKNVLPSIADLWYYSVDDATMRTLHQTFALTPPMKAAEEPSVKQPITNFMSAIKSTNACV
jgi:hypothetical protein